MKKLATKNNQIFSVKAFKMKSLIMAFMIFLWKATTTLDQKAKDNQMPQGYG